jgi:hypothetical protein
MKKDTVLKKEFKHRDVERLRNLVQGKYGDKTTMGTGYTKAKEFHDEGDIWKEDGYSLQTVKLLMPDLFKRRTDDATGATAAIFDYNGKSINGIVPSNFWFLVSGGQQLFKGEKAKERMKQELENFIKEKYSLS